MARSARVLTAQAMRLFESADAEGRELTVDERRKAEHLLSQAHAQKNVEDQIAALEYGGGVPWERGADGSVGGGLGDQFIASKEYAAIRDPGTRSEVWTSGAVELSTKGTLMSAPGTALVPAGYQPASWRRCSSRPRLRR